MRRYCSGSSLKEKQPSESVITASMKVESGACIITVAASIGRCWLSTTFPFMFWAANWVAALAIIPAMIIVRFIILFVFIFLLQSNPLFFGK